MTTSADGGLVTGGLRPVRWLVRLGACAAGATAVLAVHGLAASLGTTSRSLGDGAAAVGRCDTDGMKVTLNYGTLTGQTTSFVSATVSQIDPVCSTAVLSLDVNNKSVNASGSVTVNATTMAVPLASPVPATDSVQSDLVVTGP